VIDGQDKGGRWGSAAKRDPHRPVQRPGARSARPGAGARGKHNQAWPWSVMPGTRSKAAAIGGLSWESGARAKKWRQRGRVGGFERL